MAYGKKSWTVKEVFINVDLQKSCLIWWDGLRLLRRLSVAKSRLIPRYRVDETGYQINATADR